jgi:glycosyltransferase involved in cell wall biosynthesis
MAKPSLVVPVYNSEAILPDLVQRLSQELPSLAEEYELNLVNDCSPDRSWDVICELARQYFWIRPINLMRNYGQHDALLCGIRAARHAVAGLSGSNPAEVLAQAERLYERRRDDVRSFVKRRRHGCRLRESCKRPCSMDCRVGRYIAGHFVHCNTRGGRVAKLRFTGSLSRGRADLDPDHANKALDAGCRSLTRALRVVTRA